MAGGGSNAPLRVSFELAQDAAFDVEGLVSRKLGERIGRIQSTHLVTGTGAGQPQGSNDDRSGVKSAENTGVTYADLRTVVNCVDPADREAGCRGAESGRAEGGSPGTKGQGGGRLQVEKKKERKE